MASEQELAEMERMSGDWRPDAPVMIRGPGQLFSLVLISFC